MKTFTLTKTKVQLERQKRNRENFKKSFAELKAVVARMRRWRERVEKELQNEERIQKAAR